jgi:hypothetical protein
MPALIIISQLIISQLSIILVYSRIPAVPVVDVSAVDLKDNVEAVYILV